MLRRKCLKYLGRAGGGGPKTAGKPSPTPVPSAPGPPESSKRLETSSKSWLLGVPRPLQRPPGLSNSFQLASKALQSLPTGLRSLQNGPQVTQKPSPNHPKPVLRPSKPTSGPAAEGVALKITFYYSLIILNKSLLLSDTLMY